MARKSTVEVAAQWTVTAGELGQLIGLSAGEVRRRLVDENDQPVEVRDLPPDGVAWVRFLGSRIPGRKDANGHLRFIAADGLAALRNSQPYH